MKLLIAIPAMDFICTEFVKSLLRLTDKLKDDGVDFETRIEAGTLVYFARDKLARYAMNNGFTHVLWLDSDMVFEPEILEDLQFSGKSFVSGSRFRLPEYFRVLEYTPEFKALPDNCFELCSAVTVLKFKTEVAREKLC